MVAMFILIIGIALIGSVSVLGITSQPVRTTHEGSIHSLTDHFLSYAWGVGRYVSAQESAPGVPFRDYTAPFSNNSIPLSEIVPYLMTHYNHDNRWSNVVENGWITIYTVMPLDPRTRMDFNKELTYRSNGSHGVGVVSDTREIISFRHGRTQFYVPAAVPVGSIVMHYKSS